MTSDRRTEPKSHLRLTTQSSSSATGFNQFMSTFHSWCESLRESWCFVSWDFTNKLWFHIIMRQELPNEKCYWSQTNPLCIIWGIKYNCMCLFVWNEIHVNVSLHLHFCYLQTLQQTNFQATGSFLYMAHNTGRHGLVGSMNGGEKRSKTKQLSVMLQIFFILFIFLGLFCIKSGTRTIGSL